MNIHEFEDELSQRIEMVRDLQQKLQPNIREMSERSEGFWIDASDVLTGVTVRLKKLLKETNLRTGTFPLDLETIRDRSVVADPEYIPIPDGEHEDDIE
jgi:hypothetical protein